jgi:hypothetical protein
MAPELRPKAGQDLGDVLRLCQLPTITHPDFVARKTVWSIPKNY